MPAALRRTPRRGHRAQRALGGALTDDSTVIE
jgi:hypothetical protein